MLHKTKIRINPTELPSEILTDPYNFFSHDLFDDLQIVPTKKFLKKRHGGKAYIHFGPSNSITVEITLEPGNRLRAQSYTFNPTKLIWGHNGASLTSMEFPLAICLLVDHLEQLFESRDVALSLIPGFAPNNHTWFEMLEIATHRFDPVLSLFNAFNGASHPCSQKRRVTLGESVRIGNKRSKTAIVISRRQVTMPLNYEESNVSCDEDVLRLEVILKNDHLYREFNAISSPSVVFQDINGIPRLTRFSGDDLMPVYRNVMSRCKGPHDDASLSKDRTNAFDSFIEQCHHGLSEEHSNTDYDFEDLYYKASRETTNKMGLIRSACMQQRERSALSTQSSSAR